MLLHKFQIFRRQKKQKTMASNNSDASNLKEVFANFAKFGEGAKSTGTTISLKNADKWMKQAKVFTKSLTTTDTGITFSKFKYRRPNDT